MKKKIAIGLGVLAFLLVAYYVIKKLRTTKLYPWMKTWSDKKMDVYKDWFVNQYSQHSSLKSLPTSERTEKATLMFYDGSADVINIDSYWRGKWEEWYKKVMQAQSLNSNGYKI